MIYYIKYTESGEVCTFGHAETEDHIIPQDGIKVAYFDDKPDFNPIDYIFDGVNFTEKPFDLEAEVQAIRMRRNQMLISCDWTQLPDTTADKDAWSLYRQQLRDLTNDISDPSDVVWPTPPSL
jgi:hypothetical protein